MIFFSAVDASGCNEPLGLTTGTIQNFQLTSNAVLSDADERYYPPWKARAGDSMNRQEGAEFKAPLVNGATWFQVTSLL